MCEEGKEEGEEGGGEGGRKERDREKEREGVPQARQSGSAAGATCRSVSREGKKSGGRKEMERESAPQKGKRATAAHTDLRGKKRCAGAHATAQREAGSTMKRTRSFLCKASQSSAVERTSGGRVVKKRELRWERACGAAPQRPRGTAVAAAAAAAPNHH